jgi:glycosyltransferase involved in cell wall biosynthesis
MMISVVVPAYNEHERIEKTLAGIAALPFETEVIVVDDGSRDDTAEIAERFGADTVLRVPHGGKGRALQVGCKVAQGTVLLLLDADLGDSAAHAGALVTPLIDGAADMTIAVLPAGSKKGGGMGLVVRLARLGIRLYTGRYTQAPLSGQRAIKRELLDGIGGFAEGWGAEAALTILALTANFRVLEVECDLKHRVTGRSIGDILHRLSQFKDVLVTLVGLRARVRALKLTGASR